jgi:hypothetical protein
LEIDERNRENHDRGKAIIELFFVLIEHGPPPVENAISLSRHWLSQCFDFDQQMPPSSGLFDVEDDSACGDYGDWIDGEG